jgi:hypothetical protein
MFYNNPNDYWKFNRDLYKGLSEKESMKAACLQCVVFIVMVLLGLGLCALMGSCKSVEYVPVPQQHTEHHWHTDSVHQTDSVIMERETVVMQLDSEAMTAYGIQMKSAERAWLVKTAEMEKQIARMQSMSATRDTVKDTVTVVVPAGKQKDTMTWWQKARMYIDGFALGLVAVLVIISIRRRG